MQIWNVGGKVEGRPQWQNLLTMVVFNEKHKIKRLDRCYANRLKVLLSTTQTGTLTTYSYRMNFG